VGFQVTFIGNIARVENFAMEKNMSNITINKASNPKPKITLNLGLPAYLTITFIILKLTHVINWSWWWIWSPLLIVWGMLIVLMVIAVVLAVIVELSKP
jgi:hypothetical protein